MRVKQEKPSRRRSDPREPIAGFESVSRYWDTRHDCFAVNLLPGQFYVTRADELIMTVLGSCVTACIRDPFVGIGGMNHFMLPIKSSYHPEVSPDQKDGYATRYGSFAMERLVNVILKHGGKRQRLEVKVFGGANICNMRSDIGAMNREFVYRYCETEGLAIVGEDLGGTAPRKIQYFLETGVVRVKKLRDFQERAVESQEEFYREQLSESTKIENEPELF